MYIFLAILLGTFFGFVLQRIGAADPDKIIGMLLLKDTHLIKTILMGIGVSSSILFISMASGFIDSNHLSVKSMNTGVLVGGGVLGFGWALAAFCPGTGLVAAGTGRIDALFFILGGLIGSGIFILMYSSIADTFLFKNLFGGKITLANTDKYAALLEDVNGTLIAIVIGVVMIFIAAKIPESLR